MSPQNVLIDTDGVARVIDFGVAKAAGRLQSTRDGLLKGKLQYMAPEQIMGGGVDRRSDIYAASVVLWETLTGRRMFKAENDAALLSLILSTIQQGTIEPPSKIVSGLPRSLDAIVLKGLTCNPDDRFSTAREMAVALEKALVMASTREVGDWIVKAAGNVLREKAERIAEIESVSSVSTLRTVSGMEVPSTSPGSNPSLSAFTPSYSGLHGSNPPVEVLTSPGLPSNVSSSPGFAQPTSQNANWPMLAAILGGSMIVAAGVLGAVIWLKSRPQAAVLPPVLSSPAAVAAPAPSSSAPEVHSAKPESGSQSLIQDAGTESSAPSDTAPNQASTAKKPGPASTAKKPDKAADKKPAADCDPPYTIDGSGVKRYKPQCLK
jgi:serine/threonine-protein kinase